MSLSDIERKYDGEKGNKPIIELPKEHVLFLQAIRTLAENWLTEHPYSRVARNVARSEYEDIRIKDVVKLLKLVVPQGEAAKKFLR